MAPPNSGSRSGPNSSDKVRQRRGEKEADHDDDDAVLDAAASQWTWSRNRPIFVALGVAQVMLLVGFAYVSHSKKATASPGAPKGLVTTALTEESLKTFVAGHPEGALVYWHMTGCSHCETLSPEFEKANRELQAKGATPLAHVSASVAPKATETYGVHRFPTMLWFRKGQNVLEVPPTARTAPKIVEFVEWAGQPSVIEFETREELDEALPQLRAALHAGAHPVIIGFAGKPETFDVLEAAAERARGKTAFLFFKKANADDPPLRAYYNDATLDTAYEGAVEQEAVSDWIKGLLAPKEKKEEKTEA